MSEISNFRKRVRKWKLPAFLLNRYVFTSFVFIVWMLFFDQNNLFVQMERYQTLQETRNKMEYYAEATDMTKLELEALLTNEETLERFAREQYFMKKPNEDVFVIIEE